MKDAAMQNSRKVHQLLKNTHIYGAGFRVRRVRLMRMKAASSISKHTGVGGKIA